MQRPSVGRIVHYGVGNKDGTDLEAHAAIITKVLTETVVDLTVFPPGEEPGVTLQVDNSPELRDTYWSWPPRV